jgi:hypothetical protein
MADYRLKIKIGDNEFEAEGDAETVQSQFAMFKELVSNAPAKPAKPLETETDNGNGLPDNGNGGGERMEIDKIMKVDGRVVSLLVRPARNEDAVLLILLGQRHYRKSDSVTGGEIKDGLKQSGHAIERPDRILDRLSANDQGLVITIGERKGRRYRLTNAGLTKAQDMARKLISLIP